MVPVEMVGGLGSCVGQDQATSYSRQAIPAYFTEYNSHRSTLPVGRVSDPVYYCSDPVPTSQYKPDPYLSVMKIFQLYFVDSN